MESSNTTIMQVNNAHQNVTMCVYIHKEVISKRERIFFVDTVYKSDSQCHTKTFCILYSVKDKLSVISLLELVEIGTE